MINAHESLWIICSAVLWSIMAKEVPQSVKISLKAVLLSCEKSKGVKQTAILKDFYKLNSYKLDVSKYGYRDVYEFLLAVPDVARLEYSPKDGENRVFGVGGEGVFMSAHAKKAQGVPNGLKPLPPSEWPRNKAKGGVERTVVESKSSVKVTVPSDSKKKILPNAHGQYALHIKNLPLDCQENDLNSIFKKYQSLMKVKIEKTQNNRIAFVTFSNHQDAVAALKEIDGFNLKGCTLIVTSAIKQPAQAEKKLKGSAMKKQENERTFKKESELSTSGKNDNGPLPLTRLTVANPENWEQDGGWDKAARDMIIGKEDLESCVVKMDGGYPIHVSNFPEGTCQSTLKEMFGGCGQVIQVVTYRRFAFIYFSKKEEAITALVSMQGQAKLGAKYLTVTPRYPKDCSKQRKNFTGASTTSLSSSQSSLSSDTGSSSMSLSAANQVASFSEGSGLQDNDNCAISGRSLELSPCKKLDGNVTRLDHVSNCSSDTCSFQGEKKLGQNFRVGKSSGALSKGGFNASNTKPGVLVSENLNEKVPMHLLLTYEEMNTLMSKCRKSLRTARSIAFEEFYVLVTDVVDSCHFWANVDDRSDSYKKLKKIQEELQTVEHYRHCMPVKYQLGAALFAEDKQWYRCWCVEVSRLEKREAKVFFVDYGNFEWISWDQFTDIAEAFWDLAPQALPFKLSGLENVANLATDVQTEGPKYLRDLICNKVCKAKKTKSSDLNEPHIVEVELVLDDTSVNQQMAKTRYVQETRTTAQKADQSPSPPQSIPTRSPPSEQPQRHIPPHPFMKTETAHEARATALTTSRPPDHTPKLLDSTQPQSTQSPFQGGQPKSDPQTLPKAKFDPMNTLPKGDFQHQKSLPNHLFAKREVVEIFISNVVSPDDLCCFFSGAETKFTLRKIQNILNDGVCPATEGGKIYPRKGALVMKVQNKKKFRVEIIDIPGNAGHGIDQVKVRDIDYGNVEMTPLKALYPLPASVKCIPPQAKYARLAGIRKKEGMKSYPDLASAFLFNAKKRRRAMQASIVKREPNGLYYLELFESSTCGPSFNVQLVDQDYAEIDPLQFNMSPPDFACFSSDGSNLLESQRFHNNQRSSGGQTPRLVEERKPESLQWETHSVHSDWEEHLIEIKDRDDVSPAGSRLNMSGRQSVEQLYVPPPPQMHTSYTNTEPWSSSSSKSIDFSESPGATSGLHHDGSHSSRFSSSELCELELPPSAGLASGTNLDVHSVCSAETKFSVFSNLVCPRSPSATGSDTSGVCSDTSVSSLTSTGSFVNKEDQSSSQENVLAPQQSVDGASTLQDYKEREELVQKDEELKRILEMPRKEMKKILSLRQEKEKLERKIRIKGLENHILKLQKELKHLEEEKEGLENELGP